MKTSGRQYLYSVFRQALQELSIWSGKAAQFFMRTPLPRLFLLCIGFALIISIVPLVLTLFVVFILVKLFLLLLFTSAGSKNERARQYAQYETWRDSQSEQTQIIHIERVTRRHDE